MSSTPKNQPKNSLVFSIYSHLMLGIGVVLTVVSIFLLLNTLSNRFLYPKYPMGYDENRCDYLTQQASQGFMPSYPSLSGPALEQEKQRFSEDNQRATRECFSQLERDRQQRAKSDLVTALNVLVAAALLTIPHALLVKRLNSL